LLGEGVAFISADREKSYTDLMIWQNKASWLIFLGCALIIMCTFAREWPILFLAGAAGGFLSRLARVVKSAATPTDYGASWTTFFLSPVLGALMGWFGIILLVALNDIKILNPSIIGNLLPSATTTYVAIVPNTSIALAFLLGFSERHFDTLVNALENNPLFTSQEKQNVVTPSTAGPGGASGVIR